MCGFVAYYGDTHNLVSLEAEVNKIRYRGPDNSSHIQINNMVQFFFHRLSIIDISYAGNQPLKHPEDDKLWLVCNGEIYNYKSLIEEYDLKTSSGSDCEVILHLYKLFGIEKTLDLLDGVYAFALYDENKKELIAARDPFGVRPAFFGKTHNGEIFISSEIKAISNICNSITPFPPGTYWRLSGGEEFFSHYNYTYKEGSGLSEDDALRGIKEKLSSAVEKRLMSDREVGCLLSGGLDSSLIASLVSRLSGKKIKTFSIGMEGSPDLKYARMVADWIDSDHHEVMLSSEEFLNAIETVIYNIESYDTTTVRASVGNYLVSKYIKDNTDCKVVFNGDGSDEVCCGYIYNMNAPSKEELQEEAVRLIKEIHLFDVLRSDRSVSSNGLEARTPFLDKDFVDFYMTIPPELKEFDKTNKIEKYLLRKAFESEALLPSEVLWRGKCAFSDGVSKIDNSWHTILQDFINKKISDKQFEKESKALRHCKPLLKESFYYRKIFEEHFENHVNVIPHFWMPKWTDAIDPSAREISGYKE